MLPLFYDCEILALVDTGKQKRVHINPLETVEVPVYRHPGIPYAKDFQDYENMGISVLGFALGDNPPAFVVGDERVSCHREIVFRQFQALAAQSYVIGFNTIQFDDNLCAAQGIQIKTSYDLLLEVRIAAGFSADYKSVPRGYSYKLEHLAIANGLPGKLIPGALAPLEWHRGQYGLVTDYACQDADWIRTLLRRGLRGELIDPNTGLPLKLRPLPEHVEFSLSEPELATVKA